ncbi:MAG: hypothetical protein DRJ06_09090 [Candidatus Aminicenantes bacterium]|nr:MAG: hypothetical protein DRJ06_09090 [Candidatus Aminicenantes bacterium]
MSRYKIKPLLSRKFKSLPIEERPSKVSQQDFAQVFPGHPGVSSFLNSIPNILAGRDFKELIKSLRFAFRKKKPIIFGCGAHVIKVGLNPLLINLMERGWLTALVLNGAGIIHDFELALVGKTSEDVEAQIKKGEFGTAEETGAFLNQAIKEGAVDNLGLGEAIGRALARFDLPFKENSLLYHAYRLNIPVTVHVSLGSDIIHFHPQVDGAATGQTSLRDFFLLAALIAKLEGGGVYLNIGSAVVLPEVFLKAVAYVRNQGYSLEKFVTAVFDFKLHYRPLENVVRRPLGRESKGYYFIGHHEIMIPLLAAALLSSKKEE